MSIDAREAAAKMLIEQNRLRGIAPFMIGAIIDVLLFGIVAHQVLVWGEYSWRTETRLTRSLVIWVTVMALSGSIINVVHIWYLFAYKYGLYLPFFDSIWEPVQFMNSCLSRLAAGGFFAMRAWKMTGKSKIFAAVAIFFFITAFAGALGTFFVAYETGTTFLRVAMILVWGLSEVFSDMLFTSTIAFGLYRSRTGWSHTDALVKRLLFLVAETQLPPTMIAIAFVPTYIYSISHKTNEAWMFSFNAKAHVICFLAVLNGKVKLREEYVEKSDVQRHTGNGAPGRQAVVGAAYGGGRQPGVEEHGAEDDADADATSVNLRGLGSFRRDGVTSPRSAYLSRGHGEPPGNTNHRPTSLHGSSSTHLVSSGQDAGVEVRLG